MRKESGFSLLEVLIAVFVLAIGLLGVAGLQLVSMKSGHSAFLRSQATLMAYSIVDDIRANRPNAGDYAVAWTDTPPSSPVDLAEEDIRDWLTSLASQLPAGDGEVDVSNNPRIVVSVRWADKGPQSQSGTKTVSLETDI